MNVVISLTVIFRSQYEVVFIIYSIELPKVFLENILNLPLLQLHSPLQLVVLDERLEYTKNYQLSTLFTK